MINYEPQFETHEFVASPPIAPGEQVRTESKNAFTSNGLTLEDLNFADQSGLSQCKSNLEKFAFAQRQLNSGKVAEAAERFGSAFPRK